MSYYVLQYVTSSAMVLLFRTQQMHQTNLKLKLMTRNKQTRGRNLWRNQLVNQQRLKHRLSHLLNPLQNNWKQVSYTSFYGDVYLFVQSISVKFSVAVILPHVCNRHESWMWEVCCFGYFVDWWWWSVVNSLYLSLLDAILWEYY